MSAPAGDMIEATHTSEGTDTPHQSGQLPDRNIGIYKGSDNGPTLLCVASVHGNEPSGTIALQRVFKTLNALKLSTTGTLVGLIGNRRAYAANKRFIQRDLNRLWNIDRVRKLRNGIQKHLQSSDHAYPQASEDTLPPEDLEQIELLIAMHHAFDNATDPIYCLDMHTTSAHGAPFTVVGDTLPNRAFARHFHVPIILGLEERLGGTLPEYTYQLGHVTVGFEGGQHNDPNSIDVHEAAIWVAMMSIGILDPNDIPDCDAYHQTLRNASAGLPSVLEVKSRHALDENHTFKMKPGFKNLHPVNRGDLLATDNSDKIHANRSGWLLMPLYQGQGHDGFFLTKSVRPFWLKLSSLLRRLNADALAHWLPGVHRHPENNKTLIVDPAIARWYTTEIFHLLGFRQRTRCGDKIIVSRREHDTPLTHKRT